MKKRNNPREPLGLLYGFAVFSLGTALRILFRIKIDKTRIRGITSPVIVIANHQSNYDFAVTAMAMWPMKLNFLVSSYFMNSKLLRGLLKLVGTIPKVQFVPDSSAALLSYRAIKNNQSIIIFPEGQVEYYGAEVTIDESIAKLIKRFKVPVVNIKLRGGFLTNGKWSKRSYPARREVIIDTLLTKDQIAIMSEQEILKEVKEAISYNEYDWQRQKMIPTRRKRLTTGLQNILYRCPSCEKDFAMLSKKDTLYCEYCSYTVKLNKYGFFEAVEGDQEVIFDNTADWFRMQQRQIKKEIESILPYTTQCELRSTNKNSLGYSMRGSGVLTIDRDGLYYEGTRDNEEYSALFSHKVQSEVTHSADVWGIDFIGEDCNYAFCPDDPRKMIKIVEMYSLLKTLEKVNVPQ